MLKKLGSVGNNFFKILFFITELMLDAFLHLTRDILTRFCHTGNNDLLDIKNYIGRQKYGSLNNFLLKAP